MSDRIQKLDMASGLEKVATPRGDGRSLTPLSPYDVNVSYGQAAAAPGSGSNWFGPLSPMQPIAPPDVAGRAFDFMPGFNLVTEPRASEPITFSMLRMLAESYDPVRLILERRKDQVCRMPWAIRAKHEGHGKRPPLAALSPSIRSTIRDVTEFFKAPTFGIPFRQWLRIVLEDHLVIDAPALFCERNYSGALLGLQPIDGGLIKRVIDAWGRTPRPIPWDGEPYSWNGLEITAQNYREKGFKFVNGYLLPPAYQQILKGLPAVDYTTHDLVYRPVNLRSHRVYGFSPVEQIITTVNIAMRRNLSQLDYYREGNQPESIYGLPETWSPDQTMRFQDYWDNLHVGNLGMRRRMKFLPAGSNSAYTAIKEPPLKAEFDEWLIRIVCFAFSYPPAAFVSLSNRSIAEQHEKQAEEEGLQPTKLWVADLINDVIENELDDSIEFCWIEEEEIDQVKQSEVLTRYAESGAITLNQLREKIGEEPDPNPSANTLMVRTPTGYVPIGAATTLSNSKELPNA